VPADSVSIRIYSGIARFPCDSMAFLLNIMFYGSVCLKIPDALIRFLVFQCDDFEYCDVTSMTS